MFSIVDITKGHKLDQNKCCTVAPVALVHKQTNNQRKKQTNDETEKARYDDVDDDDIEKRNW